LLIQEGLVVNADPRVAVITGTVAGEQIPEVRLQLGEAVTFGRAKTCGISVPHSEHSSKVSSLIATFISTPLGWVLKNGKRTRVHAKSLFAIDASFGPKAQVLLQHDADWALSWDFDVVTELTVQYRPATRVGGIAVARDRALREQPREFAGTAVAGHNLTLTTLQRRRMGALFAYRIEGAAKPADLLGAAAALTGDTERQILNTATKIKDRINFQRHVQIDHLDDLGYHLVEVAGVLGADDLPE
jgi:hypothetical protein